MEDLIAKKCTETGELGNVRPLLSSSFIKGPFELGDISGERIDVLLDWKKTIFGFLGLIQIVIHTSKLIEDHVVVVDAEVTRGCELWRNYSLNLTWEIEKYVVELSYRISDGQ